MTVLTITREDVQLKSSSGTVSRYQAGETLTQGQVVYQAASDSKYYKAENADTEEKATATLIVMSPAVLDEYFLGASTGQSINVGSTLTLGEVYCVGTTAGAIEPIGDLVTSEYQCQVGEATTTTTLRLNFTTPFVT